MQFNSHRPGSRWAYGVAVVAFAVLFLPMARWSEESAAAPLLQEATVDSASAEDKKDEATPKTPYPQIIETQPAAGSTDVDPGLKELRVTFDRDMSEGMSWTGGGPEFPSVDKSRQVRWIDKRTCVLPVTLARAKYYRVGINSKSFGNFKSADGTATPPSAIFFTTKGASKALQNRVRIPTIVEMSPENGAQDVSSGTKVLRVTFNMPMGGGMSWTGGGESFPKTPDGGRANWSRDGRTCELPVSLVPNHHYRLGLNSLSHTNFQSKWGVPLTPISYSFRTVSQVE